MIYLKNEELGEIRTILNNDGSISFNAEDTAIGFGWSFIENKNGKEYTTIRWNTINGYCEELGFCNKLQKDDFIPETLFYLLGMKANNKAAQKFQMWLAKDVIPTIRKHGLYITEELLKDKEKLQCEIDKIQNEYYELEHKNIDLEFDVKNLQAEKENFEFRNQRKVLFKISIKTNEDESYLPGLVIQIVRNYIKNNLDIILNERDEHIFVKRTPLYKELRKLIIRDRDILEVLYSMGMNVQDRIIIIPNKFMNTDYEPIGKLYY